MLRLLDALAFSGIWVASAAAALAVAASLAFGDARPLLAPLLAFSGTFAIYSLDRLRDSDHDGASAPRRTAFVVRHRRSLATGAALAAIAAAGSALAIGPDAIAIALAAGIVGVLHRRLKRLTGFKPGYITAIWLLTVVGLPAAVTGATRGSILWACALIGPALLANAIAFTARDREGASVWIGERRALMLARIYATTGALLGCVAPVALAPLALVPLATLPALAAWRRGERSALLLVDGALIAGALAACALLG